MTARFIIGDVFDGLATLEDESVDLVVTSPPFLALRSYLPPDHPDKAKEIGSESTPGEFLDVLLDVVEACERVLAPHGSIAVELGDTYAGSGGAGGDYNEGGLRDGQPRVGSVWRRATRSGPDARYDRGHDSMPETGGAGWPLEKSLCCVPALFETALSYGFQPAHRSAHRPLAGPQLRRLGAAEPAGRGARRQVAAGELVRHRRDQGARPLLG